MEIKSWILQGLLGRKIFNNTLDLNRETSTDCFHIPLSSYSCREEKVYSLAQVFTRNKIGQHPNNGRGLIWLGHASSHFVKNE